MDDVWVSSFAEISIKVSDDPLDFVLKYQDAIDLHWIKRSRENPSFFDGTVFMLSGFERAMATFEAQAHAVRFRDYLFWREVGRMGAELVAAPLVHHIFGGALLWLRDNRAIVARAALGTMNDGRWQLPGGFIDQHDVVDDSRDGGRRIDVDGQIARELTEELGVSIGEVLPRSDYWIIAQNNQIGVVRAYDVDGPPDARLASWNAFVRQDPQEENTAVATIASVSEIREDETAPYCWKLLNAVLP
ncbi:MAG: hypothetical protein AAF742_04035 [Pseudomonadota bacterium]